MFTKLLERIKLLKGKATDNKYKAYIRWEKTGDTVFDNIMEECDRVCKRTDATLSYYNNNIKKDIESHK